MNQLNARSLRVLTLSSFECSEKIKIIVTLRHVSTKALRHVSTEMI